MAEEMNDFIVMGSVVCPKRVDGSWKRLVTDGENKLKYRGTKEPNLRTKTARELEYIASLRRSRVFESIGNNAPISGAKHPRNLGYRFCRAEISHFHGFRVRPWWDPVRRAFILTPEQSFHQPTARKPKVASASIATVLLEIRRPRRRQDSVELAGYQLVHRGVE
jgi:hypothetical protein